MSENEFKIQFWGVRGSSPIIDKEMIDFGGNTSCVEIRINGKLFILDAGTGIQRLGRVLLNKKINANIFLTHFHWDHIQGLLSFLPFFNSENKFNIYGKGRNNLNLDKIIKNIMKHPYSPISWDSLKANIRFIDITNVNNIYNENDIKIQALDLDHPDGCLGYKIENKQKSCCYITDLEHGCEINNQLIDFVNNTDLLIYDSNYTEEEYRLSKKGWGHSTWQKGVKLANETNVRKLILFHHDSFRTDNEVREIEENAKNIFKNTYASFEGMEINI